MKKPLPGTLFTIVLIFYGLLASLLVWGPALLTAEGNRMTAKGNVVGALGRYEWLQSFLPNSPYLYHNNGVCQVRLEKLHAAQAAMEKAIALYWKRPENETRPDKVGGTLYYQLGNIMMQSALNTSGNRTEASAKFYRMALVQYKKALLANPGDVDAKYNYEIALLRLGQSNQEPPPNDEMRQTTSQNEEYLNQPPPNELPPNIKDW